MYNIDNTVPKAGNGAYLAGNAIHKVKLVSVEKTEVGKDNLAVVRITLEGLEGQGTYVDTIFEPKSATREKSGPQNFESPSQVEQFQTKLRQYIAALNPNLDKDINDGTKKLGAKDWETMRDVIVAALTSKGKNIGRETELKLLKNKDGYAQAPGFIAGLTKEGKVFHRTKFIGDGLAFTDYEVQAINKANAAKATDMSAKNAAAGVDLGEDDNTSAEDLEFDIEDL